MYKEYAQKAPEKNQYMAPQGPDVFFDEAKPSQAKSQAKPSLAPKAPEKKIEHVVAKAPFFFAQAKPSQAKPSQEPSQAKFGAGGVREKNEHMAPKAPDFF